MANQVVTAPTTRPRLRRLAAVACLLGAEAIHVAVLDEHMEEWLPAGLFFFCVAVLEGAVAVALLTATSSRVERTAICLSLGTLALWLTSRTVGLPIGPMSGHPEPVGRADAVASALELTTALVLLRTTVVPKAIPWGPSSYLRAALIMAAVTASTTLGVTSEHGRLHTPPDLTPAVPPQARSR
ncbi:MAG: hypothetical protein QOF52_3437 [Propionibacteriaceae bacterium]|nr:hypothetical protein [Propionibacteriaceae bacterium]MDX6323579.1 hypothetical protein [Propionibacteriaceae bacterium]